MAQTTPPGYDTPLTDADVRPDRAEGGGGILNALTTTQSEGQSPLDKAIEAHHQRRLHEAQMNRDNVSLYAATLMHGYDPKTGKELTPEQTQMYKNMRDAAQTAYEKSAGVNKDTKGVLQQARTIVDHLIHHGRQQRGLPPLDAGAPGTAPTGANAATPAGGGGGSPAPTPPPSAPPPVISPQGTSTSSGGYPITGAGGPRMTPPPAQAAAAPQQGQTPPPAYDMKTAALEAPELRRMLEQRNALGDFKQRQEIIRDMKIDEEKAKAQAKAASPGTAPPRPVFSRPVSVLDARAREDAGYVFEDEDGNPIDLAKVPDTMSLQPFTTRVSETDDQGNTRQVWKTRYIAISPNQKTFTVGNETYAANPADVSKKGAATDLGQHTVGSTSATRDPATGQTTVTTRTPKTMGMGGGGSAPPSPPPGGGSSAPARTSGGGTGVSSAAPPPLDKDGHIPTTYKGATPQVIEGANQLLDGRDAKDIKPAKVAPLAAELARKYNWEQGKFTPLEKTQIALASRYINEAINSPSLRTLDASFFQQLPMVGASGDPAKEGNFAKALTKFAARSQTPEQAQFMQLYRQLAGTISGLGKLSRGGRITEATVNRLLSELPNPVNTRDSADAVARLNRLKDEIDAALSKGTFEEIAGGRTGAASSSGVVRWTRDKDGNPVQANP